jgi:hypothetical protein
MSTKSIDSYKLSALDDGVKGKTLPFILCEPLTRLSRLFRSRILMPIPISTLLLYLLFTALNTRAFAEERTPLELTDLGADGGEVALFWILLISVGFFQGTLIAVILMGLKVWKYQDAGTRWTLGVWLGFPLGGACYLASTWLYRMIQTQTIDTLISYDGVAMSLSTLASLSLCCVCAWRLARWCAHEP